MTGRRIALRALSLILLLSIMLAAGHESGLDEPMEIFFAGGGSGLLGIEDADSPGLENTEMALAYHEENMQRAAAASASAESMDVDADGDGVADIAVVVDNGLIVFPLDNEGNIFIDIVEIGREFYRTHGDNYDQLVVFLDFPVLQQGTAFHALIQNATTGINVPLADFSFFLGSAGELEGFNMMYNIDQWFGTNMDQYVDPQLRPFRTAPNPAPLTNFSLAGFVDDTGPGFSAGATHRARRKNLAHPTANQNDFSNANIWGEEGPMTVLAQEVGHRWLARLFFRHPFKPSLVDLSNAFNPANEGIDLMGRGLAHWSFFMNGRIPDAQFSGDPRASAMDGGNAILELRWDAQAGQVVGCHSFEEDANGDLTVCRQGAEKVLDDPKGFLKAMLVGDPEIPQVQPCSSLTDSLGNPMRAYFTERDSLTDGYHQLDHYAMGLRKDDQVEGFWYVDEPTSALNALLGLPLDFARSAGVRDDLGFCGSRVDLTVDDIVAFEQVLADIGFPPLPEFGERGPALGDEQDSFSDGTPISGGVNTALCNGNPLDPARTSSECIDVKTVAFVLVTRDGPPQTTAHASAIRRVNEFRKAFDAYMNGPAAAGIGARGCKAGFSGVAGQCFDPFAGAFVAVGPSGATPDYIPKFDSSLNPSIH